MPRFRHAQRMHFGKTVSKIEGRLHASRRQGPVDRTRWECMRLCREARDKVTAMDSNRNSLLRVVSRVLLVALPFFWNSAAGETYPFCSRDLPPRRVVSRVPLTDKNKGVIRDLDTVSHFLGPELIICYEWQDVKVVAYQHRLRKVMDYSMRGCDDYIPFTEEAFAYRLAVLSPFYYLQMMRYFCDEEQKWSRVDVQRSDSLVTHTVIEPQTKAIFEEYIARKLT